MRRAITFLSVSCLFAVGVIWAGNTPALDFDKQVDSTGIVEHAKQQGQMRRGLPRQLALHDWELPVEILKAGKNADHLVAKPESSVVDNPTQKAPLPLPRTVACDEYPTDRDDPGGPTPSLCGKGKLSIIHESQTRISPLSPVTGPYQPIVRDNPEYQQALSLRTQLEGGVGLTVLGGPVSAGIPGSGPLLAEFPAMAAHYDQAFKMAVALDRDDESLSDFADRIISWDNRMRARSNRLDTDGEIYDRLCLSHPVPPDEKKQCDAYVARYNQCVRAHNASLQKLRALAKVWQDQKACLQAKGDSFKSSFADWIKTTVLSWIGRAKKVADDGYDCKLTRIEKINNNPRWAVHCSYACKSRPGEHCGIAWAWDHDPNIGEIMAVCPDFSTIPPVSCPAPF